METRKILFVDDDVRLLSGIRRTVGLDFEIDTAVGGEQALQLVKGGARYAVAVVDMRMPEMDGMQLLHLLQELTPNTVRMMLTGNADQETAVKAVNDGHVYRFLNKPCDDVTMKSAILDGLHFYELQSTRNELLEKTLTGSMRILTQVLSVADPANFGKSQKLRDLVHELCKKARYQETWQLEVAAMLSGIGMITLPSELLAKIHGGKTLTREEQDLVSHTNQAGHELLAKLPYLEPVALSILHQDRHFDAPDAPRGEGIPLGARVLKILKDLLDLEIESGNRETALRLLSVRRRWYDPQLMNDVLKYLAPQSEGAFWSEPMENPIRCILPGQMLANDVRNTEGIIIASAKTVLTQSVIDHLKSFAKIGAIPENVYVFLPPSNSTAA